jgi:hypothetical protein
MKHKDQFISQTGKHPEDWASQDMQKYLDYVKTQVSDVTALTKDDD